MENIKENVKNVNVYIALDQSVSVPNKGVHVEDIATVFSTNKDVAEGVKKIKLHQFTKTDMEYAVISAMKLIEQINITYKDVTVINIGTPETIVYYKNTPPTKKYAQFVKAAFMMILTFFGTAYTIMSYNGDVGSDSLLQRIYMLFTGIEVDTSSPALLPGIIGYSLGLGIGMIIFFNHGLNKNSVNDPTPLQVQMRLYEKEVNESIITDSTRKGTIIDVD
jgi:stage V sporulation protein AA